MSVDISILLPAIRKERWVELYNSISKSTKRKFELIIVGPYSLPDELQTKRDVKFIKEWGNPVRASQIASLVAEGKYLTWAADDGVYLEGALDRAIDYLDNKPNKDIKDVVVNNYFEAGLLACPGNVLRLKVAYPPHTYLSDDWYIFNVATMYTEFFYDLGGYECAFEVCPFAHADLAARAQRSGANVHVLNEPMLDCTHMPGTSGDHAPVHYAQTEHDQQLYARIYENSASLGRTKIDINNWKTAPSVWKRRFKEKRK